MDPRTAKRIRSLVLSLVVLAAGVVLFALAAHTPPGVSSAADAEASVRVTILQVNDTHGQLGGLTVRGRRVGGAARLATAIKKVRQASSANRVLLVHCGDVFSRGDALTQRTAGAANVTVMNHLGYDLWVLGNGEFYNGLDVLRQRMTEAKYPILAANVTVDGEALARPYVIEKAGPARIAFFGLSTVGEQSREALGVDEADAIETARTLVPKLIQQADVLVAATHLGLPEDVRLAAAVEGIDLILGAHSHTVLHHGFRAKGPGGREILICQAGSQYRYLGQVDLELSAGPAGQGFRLANVTAKLIPLDETVEPDPATEALLAELDRSARRLPAPPPTLRPAGPPATRPMMTTPAPATSPAATSPALVPASP